MDPDEVNNDATGGDEVENTEADEWEEATAEFLADKDVEISEPKDDDDEDDDDEEDEEKPEKDGEEEKPDKEDDDPEKKSEKKENPEEEPGDDGDEKDSDPEKAEEAEEDEEDTPEEKPVLDPREAERLQRTTQLEIEADRKEIAADVREQMFSEIPTELLDADGDPITSIADVMALQNPATETNFTAVEATQWLMQAQRHLEKQQDEVSSKIENIVGENIRVKDEADSVKAEYGKVLDNMPNLSKKIMAEYRKTLVIDKNTGIITSAPVSMKSFYDAVLPPYVEQINAEIAKSKEGEEEAEVVAKKKAEVSKKKKKTQSDREDLLSNNSQSDNMDPEEKEWAQAAKEYYED